MKRRLWGALAGIVVFGFLAVTVAGCGGGKKMTAVVTTLAGQARSKGSTDGSGASARFYWPSGIACDAAGNLYVADERNNTIRKITPAGEVTTLAGKAHSKGSADGSAAAARFNSPEGIACDSAGNLYVADARNSTIRKITPAGEVTTLAGEAGFEGSTDGWGTGARFAGPCGIACDAAGNLYVTDTGNNTIRKVTSAGKVTTVAGTAGDYGGHDGKGTAARFWRPDGLACDAAGNLYVADAWNDTIRKITPAGEVSTFAGTAHSAGSADGSGAAARFNGPWGIARDASGSVYVADAFNSTIRKMTLSQ